MERFDPHATEERYTLDYLCFLAARSAPASILVHTEHPDPAEVTKAVARRLAPAGAALRTTSRRAAEAVRQDLGLSIDVADSSDADAPLAAGVCPWIAGRPPPAVAAAPLLVGCLRNALSYRSLRYPGSERGAALAWLRRLESTHHVRARVGFLPPMCVALLAAARLARLRHPRYSYLLEDYAMARIFTRGPAWAASYVVIFAADRR
jgi:hypothetical protein